MARKYLEKIFSSRFDTKPVFVMIMPTSQGPNFVKFVLPALEILLINSKLTSLGDIQVAIKLIFTYISNLK